MKKLAVTVLSLFLALNSSQASTSKTAQFLDSRKRSVSMSRMQTKSVLVRAVPKAQRRLLITKDLTDTDDGPPGPDELDMQSPYRRSQVSKILQPVDDTTDYVLVRLAVARARAMEAYRRSHLA